MNGVWSLSPAIKRTLLSCTSGVHFIEIPLCLLKRYVDFNQRYYEGGLEGGVHEKEQGWTRGEGGQNLAILRDRTFWMSPRHTYTIPYKYIYIYIYIYGMVYGMYIVYIYIWYIYGIYTNYTVTTFIKLYHLRRTDCSHLFNINT